MPLAGQKVQPPPADQEDQDGSSATRSGTRAPWLLTVAMAVALLLLTVASAGLGACHLSVGDVLASVAHRVGLRGSPLDRVGESVLWNVRFPRIVLALLTGASLGCAGALMQGCSAIRRRSPG